MNKEYRFPCLMKGYFTSPEYKDKYFIVEFEDECCGTVIESNFNTYHIGYKSEWVSCYDDSLWTPYRPKFELPDSLFEVE